MKNNREFEGFILIDVSADDPSSAGTEEQPAVNSSPDELSSLQVAAPSQVNVRRVGRVARDVIGIIAEVVEGGAIGYAVYLIPAEIDAWEGLWGYGMVGLGATLVGGTELLRHIPVSKHRDRTGYLPIEANMRRLVRFARNSQHTLQSTHLWMVNHSHHFHMTLESLVGALVIGNYFSQLAPTAAAAFAINLAVTMGSTGLHLSAKVLEDQRRLPKILKYPFYVVYGSALGFGIGDLLLSNMTGFGVNVPTWANWLTLSGLALPNIYAQLAPQTAAKVLRSSFYGMEVALFFAILAFDMIEDISNNSDFSNSTVGIMYAVASLLGVFSMLAHYNDELRHQAEHAHDHPEANLDEEHRSEFLPNETTALRPRIEIIDEEAPSRQLAEDASVEQPQLEHHLEEPLNTPASEAKPQQASAPSSPKPSELSKSLSQVLNPVKDTAEGSPFEAPKASSESNTAQTSAAYHRLKKR